MNLIVKCYRAIHDTNNCQAMKKNNALKNFNNISTTHNLNYI